jgi:hypothetical protein
MELNDIFMWIAIIIIIIGFIVSIHKLYINGLLLEHSYGIILSIIGTVFAIGFSLLKSNNTKQ